MFGKFTATVTAISSSGTSSASASNQGEFFRSNSDEDNPAIGSSRSNGDSYQESDADTEIDRAEPSRRRSLLSFLGYPAQRPLTDTQQGQDDGTVERTADRESWLTPSSIEEVHERDRKALQKVLEHAKLKIKEEEDIMHPFPRVKIRGCAGRGRVVLLSLSGCGSMVYLPPEIGQLKQLNGLYLDECQSLMSLPPEIGQLVRLKELFLGQCKSLISLPAEIGQLRSMKQLNLTGCKSMIALPPEVGKLPRGVIICGDGAIKRFEDRAYGDWGKLVCNTSLEDLGISPDTLLKQVHVLFAAARIPAYAVQLRDLARKVHKKLMLLQDENKRRLFDVACKECADVLRQQLDLVKQSKNATGCISDNPQTTVDRLGFSVYATALTKAARGVEGPFSSLCVGLYASWGSGKTFLWKLVQDELNRASHVKLDLIKNNEIDSSQKQEESTHHEANVGLLGGKLVSEIQCYWCKGFIGGITGILKGWIKLWEKCCCCYFRKGRRTHDEYVELLMADAEGREQCQEGRNSTKHAEAEWIATIVILTFVIPGAIMLLLFALATAFFPIYFFYTFIRTLDSTTVSLCFRGTGNEHSQSQWAGPLSIEQDSQEELLGLVVKLLKGDLTFGDGISNEEEEGVIGLFTFIRFGAIRFAQIAVWSFACLQKSFRTFLASLCCARLCGQEGEEKHYSRSHTYIMVHFNAWVYHGSDLLWASMIKQLWTAVEAAFGKDAVRYHRWSISISGESQEDMLHERKRKRRLAALRFRLRVVFSFAFSLLSTALILTLSIIPALLDDYEKKTAQLTFSFIIVVMAQLPSLQSISESIQRWQKFLRLNEGDKLFQEAKASQSPDFKEEAGFMGVVKEELEYLFDFLRTTPLYDTENGCYRLARLCLFVDDLDRCDATKVVQVLQATILLLVDAPITIWLAIDRRIVVSSIEEQYQDAFKAEGVNGDEYLDKIVQLPFCLPQVDSRYKVSFFRRLAHEKAFNTKSLLERLVRVSPELVVRALTEHPTAEFVRPKLSRCTAEVKRRINAQKNYAVMSEMDSKIKAQKQQNRNDEQQVVMMSELDAFLCLAVVAKVWLEKEEWEHEFEASVGMSLQRLVEVVKRTSRNKGLLIHDHLFDSFCFIMHKKIRSLEFGEGTEESYGVPAAPTGAVVPDAPPSRTSDAPLVSTAAYPATSKPAPPLAGTEPANGPVESPAIESETSPSANNNAGLGPAAQPAFSQDLFSPILSDNELDYLDEFSVYLNGNPRAMKRIVNIYNVSRVPPL